MRGLLIAILAWLFVGTVPVAADEREYIYGAELMTPKERDAYRQGLQQSPTEEARGQYRQRHRERLQQRAQTRGVQLDEKGVVRGKEMQR